MNEPPPFKVILTSTFQRDLESLPRQAQDLVLEAIKRLENDPYGPPAKIKKLKSKGVGRWRLEVWPYRVRYDVAGSNVVLYRVRHRKEIYRD